MILGLKGTGTLGDSLWLTPAIWGLKAKGISAKVQMHDDRQCREVATIFDNLCPVEFVDNPPERLYITNKENTHSAQRILNELKLDNVNCIPKIILNDNEIDWATALLKEYKNPVAIVNDNSGSHDLTNTRAQYVRPRSSLMQQQADDWMGEGNTVLHLISGNRPFTRLTGCVEITGFNIRQLAACYKVVGRGIFSDTGNYHLMLAVGGKCLVLVPDESQKFGYIYSDLHYTPELWRGEEIRARYCNFNTGKGLYQ
jgi:hypothetical protein